MISMISTKFNYSESARHTGYTIGHVFKFYLFHFPLTLGLCFLQIITTHFITKSEIPYKCTL